MHRVANASAATKDRNTVLALSVAWDGSSAAFPMSLVRLSVRIVKSMHRQMNTASVKTWNARPVTMIWSPTSGLLFALLVAEVMPPPAAWSRREITSQGMKIREYECGLI